MVAVDTNVLVRWLVRDDLRLAKQADNMLNTAPANTLYLDRLIIAELTYVLRSVYDIRKNQIVLNLRALVSDDRFFTEDNELMGQAIDLFEHYRALSFEDAWLLGQKRAGIVDNVHTFDAGLQKALQK